ncbi:hypothetical protein DENSPDRAFT_845592 [Dentipellis sp. KUC8613]|nr:hypothetical protein DENSPDRAFT_845592 [Dentipellis sp. KUC8613]
MLGLCRANGLDSYSSAVAWSLSRQIANVDSMSFRHLEKVSAEDEGLDDVRVEEPGCVLFPTLQWLDYEERGVTAHEGRWWELISMQPSRSTKGEGSTQLNLPSGSGAKASSSGIRGIAARVKDFSADAGSRRPLAKIVAPPVNAARRRKHQQMDIPPTPHRGIVVRGHETYKIGPPVGNRAKPRRSRTSRTGKEKAEDRTVVEELTDEVGKSDEELGHALPAKNSSLGKRSRRVSPAGEMTDDEDEGPGSNTQSPRRLKKAKTAPTAAQAAERSSVDAVKGKKRKISARVSLASSAELKAPRKDYYGLRAKLKAIRAELKVSMKALKDIHEMMKDIKGCLDALERIMILNNKVVAALVATMSNPENVGED